MPNIYQHIGSNKRSSLVVVTLFTTFVAFIGWFIGQYYFEGSGMGFVGLALIFSGVSGFISFYYSDQIVLAISGAREVKDTDNRDLHNLVENMAIASGLPKPRVYMINDTSMNAFATGRDPNHAVLCFTSGIVARLDKRELEGVVAHEMAHIGNYDIRFMSLVSVLVGTLALLADWFTRGTFYSHRRRSRSDSGMSGLLMLVGIVLVIVSPIIATLIKLALSRHREYLADATAALITRYPAGLASALKKLAQDTEVLEAANGATAHLYVVSPLRAEQGGLMANMFSTHPPITERIKRLENM